MVPADRPSPAGAPEIFIRGSRASAVSPEGYRSFMSVADLIGIAARLVGTRTTGVLPDGIRTVVSRGRATVWVHERPPQVCNLRWISPDSPVPFGPRTRYRNVRIALPYLIVLAVFLRGDDDRMTLSGANECFFRTEPLKTPSDPLCYPALLNCSKFTPAEGKPLAWICTSRMHPGAGGSATTGDSMQDQFNALRHCLLETGFNLSSERHEGTSWFTESVHVDRRISTIENWERATAEDPLFVLDVPWIPTGLGLGQVIDRIFDNAGVPRTWARSAEDLSRILFNYGETTFL